MISSRQLILTCGAWLLPPAALALPASALAGTTVVSPSLGDIVKMDIALPPEPAPPVGKTPKPGSKPALQTPPGDYTGDECKLRVTDSSPPRLTGAPEDCPALAAVRVTQAEPGVTRGITLTGPGSAEIAVRLDKLVLAEKKIEAIEKGEKMLVPGANPVIFRRSAAGEWKELGADGFEFAAGAQHYILQADGIHELVAPPPPPPKGKPAPAGGPLVDDEDALAECEAHPLWLGHRSICIRIDTDSQIHVAYIPERYRDRILPPNTSIDVFVVRPAGSLVTVKLGGERGSFEPGVRDYETQGEDLIAGRDAAPAAVAHIVDQEGFAPRRPNSSADLTIEATHGASAEERASNKRTRTLEFFIEKTYSGALRLGIGVLFGPAVDHDYKVAKLDNSMQGEIVAQTGGRAEFELIAGYAPFIFDMMRGKKGRAYSAPLRERSAGFAPYIGLGVVNVAKATGVEFFRSVHLGFEWEPLPNFSIAVTGIARRVTRLQDGYTVGSPAAGTDVPTRERLSWGIGIVFNLTPEFFRFATRESSSLLRGGK